MSIQDKVDKDLKRFMYSEPPENMEELGTALRGRVVSADRGNITIRRPASVGEPRFAIHLEHKISKSRPADVRRRRGMVVYGLTFLVLATVAALILPFPINLIMFVGCLMPMILSVFVRMRRGESRRKAEREYVNQG